MTSGLKIENLDHLGLIAGVIDELGLVELLDELFPPHRDNQITTGQVVKAMILNCLGFLSAPLYLFSQFFESKPVAHLLDAVFKCQVLTDNLSLNHVRTAVMRVKGLLMFQHSKNDVQKLPHNGSDRRHLTFAFLK